jgi:iron complex outermembrane receptor protein
VSLWARNVTDTNYYNTKAVSATYGTVLAALGEPRTFGITLRAKR